MERLAEPSALEDFREDPDAWIRWRVDWMEPDCEPDPDGRGRCGFTLFSPQGGGFAYAVTYRASGDGHVITGFEPLGGGA